MKQLNEWEVNTSCNEPISVDDGDISLNSLQPTENQVVKINNVRESNWDFKRIFLLA